MLLLLLGLSAPLSADLPAGGLEDEIGGILIDRTVTLVGYRFVRELGDYRRANDLKIDENLIVYERTSARWGSLIWIMSGQDEIYRSFIGPRLTEIPAIAQQASAVIDRRLLQLQLQRQLSDKFDLDGQEF